MKEPLLKWIFHKGLSMCVQMGYGCTYGQRDFSVEILL